MNTTKRITLSLAGITSLAVSACSNVRTTTENTFTRDSNVIANKKYTGAWDYFRITEGNSLAVHIHESSFIKGTYDGYSYYYIVFQLPKDAKVGDVFKLNTVPITRKTKKIGEFSHIANMRDLEITGFSYGNPRGIGMKDAENAEVEIVSLGANKAVINLKLKADAFRFGIDRRFTLKRKKPSQR